MAMGDKLTIEALDVKNYGTWCIQMKALLIHKKLWKGVEDPSANSNESQSALAYITLYVRDHMLGTVGACETAKEAWDKLKTTYKSKSNGRKLLLKRELVSECAVNSAALSYSLFSYAQHLWSILHHMRGSHESMRKMMVEERLAYFLENAYKLFLLLSYLSLQSPLHLRTVLSTLV
jgi:hypothetical protein